MKRRKASLLVWADVAMEIGKKQKTSANDFLPPERTLATLRQAADSCKGCELYKNASQTVFGEGPEEASIVLIGEQPGDMEDRQGHPFVGPAGRILDKALAEAQISRDKVYITNAVKHFKWTPQGKRRKHQKPLMSEVMACKPWLESEVEALHAKILVCMGATAAQSVLGRNVPITKERGKFFESNTKPTVSTFITVHPSSILRQQEREEQVKEYERFVAEMKMVQQKLLSLEAA
jgi:uracil-DNA glycosylase